MKVFILNSGHISRNIQITNDHEIIRLPDLTRIHHVLVPHEDIGHSVKVDIVKVDKVRHYS